MGDSKKTHAASLAMHFPKVNPVNVNLKVRKRLNSGEEGTPNPKKVRIDDALTYSQFNNIKADHGKNSTIVQTPDMQKRKFYYTFYVPENFLNIL